MKAIEHILDEYLRAYNKAREAIPPRIPTDSATGGRRPAEGGRDYTSIKRDLGHLPGMARRDPADARDDLVSLGGRSDPGQDFLHHALNARNRHLRVLMLVAAALGLLFLVGVIVTFVVRGKITWMGTALTATFGSIALAINILRQVSRERLTISIIQHVLLEADPEVVYSFVTVLLSAIHRNRNQPS